MLSREDRDLIKLVVHCDGCKERTGEIIPNNVETTLKEIIRKADFNVFHFGRYRTERHLCPECERKHKK